MAADLVTSPFGDRARPTDTHTLTGVNRHTTRTAIEPNLIRDGDVVRSSRSRAEAGEAAADDRNPGMPAPSERSYMPGQQIEGQDEPVLTDTSALNFPERS
jgi:hypothetical protein